ncbi:uncharacterized protein LOC62_04G005774 [Vanrija pseudolonga]|uniref:Uncharacterized protein n=1 Tax=Vanrija pseudolonga TaxID=143232 RepID=A0AAF0Y8R0_9TREE|nr:hypothetical protein LOC62_04G005774 [Vanrija pseudolonga]
MAKATFVAPRNNNNGESSSSGYNSASSTDTNSSGGSWSSDTPWCDFAGCPWDGGHTIPDATTEFYNLCDTHYPRYLFEGEIPDGR